MVELQMRANWYRRDWKGTAKLFQLWPDHPADKLVLDALGIQPPYKRRYILNLNRGVES